MSLKRFITQDDKKRINRVLFETEKIKNQEKYALIVGIKLCTPNNTKFTQKKTANLSTTAGDLFNFINHFGKLHNITDEVTVHFVGDQLQNTETDTCGIFQLFSYENLFSPSELSTIINTIWKLLNEILKLDRNVNKQRMQTFAQENNITFSS